MPYRTDHTAAGKHDASAAKFATITGDRDVVATRGASKNRAGIPGYALRGGDLVLSLSINIFPPNATVSPCPSSPRVSA